MADNLDKLLSDYFTGKLDVEIKLRRMELKFSNRVPDENIGGGRKQNDYNNPIELGMIREENDDFLQNMLFQKMVIEMMLGVTIDSHVKALKAKYGQHESWTVISMDENVDEKTVRLWRDDFKDGVSSWLGATLFSYGRKP